MLPGTRFIGIDGIALLRGVYSVVGVLVVVAALGLPVRAQPGGGGPYGFIFDDRSTEAGRANHARLYALLRSLAGKDDPAPAGGLTLNLFEGAGGAHLLYIEPPSSATAHRLQLPEGVTLAGRARGAGARDTLRFGPENYLLATTTAEPQWVWLEVTSRSRRPLRPFRHLHLAWPDAWAPEARLRALPIVQDGDTGKNARALCGHPCAGLGLSIRWQYHWPDPEYPRHPKMRHHADLLLEDVSTSGMVDKVFEFGGNGRLIIANSDLRSGGMVFSLSGNGRAVLECRNATVALWRSPVLSERAQLALARHTMYGSRLFSTDADRCRFEGWPPGTIDQRWAFRAVGSENADSLDNRHVFRDSVLEGQFFLSRVSPTYFHDTDVEGVVALSGDLFMEGGTLHGAIRTDVWRARRANRRLVLRGVNAPLAHLEVTNGIDAVVEGGRWDTLSVKINAEKGDPPSLELRDLGEVVLAPTPWYRYGLVQQGDLSVCGTDIVYGTEQVRIGAGRTHKRPACR